MKKNFYIFALAAAVALSLTNAKAQTKQRRSPATNNNAATVPAGVASLPASDAVMVVDVHRLLNEALPRVYAKDAAKLAQVNADIDDFKKRTGLDARAFDSVAVGVQFAQSATDKTKLQTVAIARGRFNAGALVAAARIATNGKYQEQKYNGKTISIFNVNQRVKLLGLFNLNVTDLAVATLDAGTLAIGQPDRVRAAIDAGTGRGRINADVASLATRDPNAIIALGGSLPQSLTQHLDFLNPEISRSIAAIRQFYGTVGMTNDGFQMLTVLRTNDPDAAHTLSETVEGLKQLAPIFISQLSGDKQRAARSTLDSTKVSVQGNEVQVRFELAQTDFAAMLRSF